MDIKIKMDNYLENNNMKDSIVYTDQSRNAAAKATEYFQKVNPSLSNNIIVKVGNGLEPLLGLNSKCRCIIMAGVGCNTILNIVSHKSQSLSHQESLDSDSVSSVTADIDLQQLSLIKLGIEEIIIQPYPPLLVSILQLIICLQKYGIIAKFQNC